MGETLRVIGKIDSDRHIFTASGEILLENGIVAATATAKYMKVPVNKISQNANESEMLFMENIEKEIDWISREGALKIIYK